MACASILSLSESYWIFESHPFAFLRKLLTMNDLINWQQFDREHIWHPYTSIEYPTPTFAVESAQGVTLRLTNGQELVDGMASWWSAIHGYNHPVLNQAISEQMGKMSHVMFGGLTHEPAARLAEKLISITAEPLEYVFFADSGSISVEVAIKMAMQYWLAQGYENKKRLLTIKKGYHGDTFATMAICDPVNGMHHMFEGLLTKHLFAEAPQCKTDADWDDRDIQSLKSLLEQHHDEIAAVILEPLVQGAGGMRVYCAEYLRQVRKLCDQWNVLLILDEIATGFGRTGTLFAYEQANIIPDILCLGKALTGGYMTLAATLTSRKVSQGIAADGSGILMHGPTFMGNPLACSVANASLELLLDSPWESRVNRIEQQLLQELAPCQEQASVNEVRVKGAIGVVELKQPVDIHWLQPRLVELGVWIRPFSNLLYIMPAYIMQSEELTKLTDAMNTVVREM